MTRDLAYLLPLLLLACDAAPASSADTDDGGSGSTSSDAGTTDSPDPTEDPNGDSSTGSTDPDPTDDPDPTGEDTTGEDTTGEDTSGDDTSGDDTTGDPPVPVCGDGEVTGDETCDDGDDNGSYGSCADDCQSQGPSCGDGALDPDFESCDDGEANGDYEMCAADCQGAGPACGDGNTDAGLESCDDGDDNGSYGSCAAGCQALGPYCGDGNTDAEFEACDDGDAINGNGCNVDCVVSGSTLWELTETSIGALSNDVGYSISAQNDGSIRVGRRSEPTDTTQRVFLTDYALDGTQLGEHQHINNAPNSVDLGVQGVDPSGGYFLTWVSAGVSTNPDDVIARSGSHLIDWSTEVLDASDVVRRPGGGGLFLDRDHALEPTQWFVVDDTGSQTWFSEVNSAVYDTAIIAAGDDGLVVLGAVDIGAGLEPTVSRFTTGGILEYRTFYDLPESSSLNSWVGSSIAINDADQVVAASTTHSSADNQVLISSFNADGSLAWDTLYDHPGEGVVIVRASAIDAEGNVFVVGSARSGAFPNWDFDGLVVKYDSAGDLLWAQTYAGDSDQAEDSVRDVTTLADGSIAVTGSQVGASGTRDAWVARIAP